MTAHCWRLIQPENSKRKKASGEGRRSMCWKRAGEVAAVQAVRECLL